MAQGEITTGGGAILQPRWIARILNVLLGCSAASAVATLVMLYGGFTERQLGIPLAHLETVQKVIVAFFIFDRLFRLLLARPRVAYIKANWLDYALIVLFGLAIGIAYRSRRDVVSAGALFVIITQVYMLSMLLLRAAGANLRLAGSGLPPGLLLVGSFATLCLVGSGLLMLPAAVQPEFYARWYYPQALFTATSATCVTGLIVVDTGRFFTPFGQGVILAMIQLGGLGIMIFGTVLAMLAGKTLSMRGREAMGQMLASDRIGDIGRVVRFVVAVTFIAEAVGAVMLWGLFRSPGVLDAWGQSIAPAPAGWYAVFHSVSAFCNAGFSLYPENMMQGSAEWSSPLRDNWQILGVMAPLIVLGGLGFPVLSDAFDYLRALAVRVYRRVRHTPSERQLPRAALSLHSRVVLVSSFLLIVLGAGGLMLLELPGDGEFSQMSPARRVGAAIFQSISARTAGFNTIDMNSLSAAGKGWMCVLMTIGGSPASTAGGLKTVTAAMLVLCALSVLRRRRHIEAFGRNIPEPLLRRAVTIVLLYGLLLGTVTLLLCAGMKGEKFIDLLFEACSACGTVGFSTGVTARLSVFGELVVTGGMFIGRVGLLTLLLGLTAHVKIVDYAYPSENVVIG